MQVRLADYVMKFLADKGIEQVFLVTGGGAMHLNDAVGREKRWRWVCNHHEQASAIAAEAYSRLSNKVALVNVTTGPGGVNALNGVYGAFVDSIPMFVVSGQVKRETIAGNFDPQLRQLGDQEVDIVTMARPVTKYAVCIQDPQSIRYHLERAWHLAVGGRPGPVWLDIPVDVQSTRIDPETLEGYDPAEDEHNGHLPAEAGWLTGGDVEAEVRHFLDKLASAKRPVILAGSGVRLTDTRDQLLEIAERLGIAVTGGWNCYDLIPDDHPCAAGRPSAVGNRQGNFTVQNADLLLILGCRLNIRQISFNWGAFARGAYKIMVDIDKAELRKPTLKSVQHPVHADVRDFIGALDRLSKNETSRPGHWDWISWCKERGAKYPVVEPGYAHNREQMNPYVFAHDFFALLDEDEVIVAGDGTASVVPFQASPMKARTRCFTNAGAASMGYDLPAAVGAACGTNRRVIALAGDGSAMMNMQELQTIITNRLPVKVILLNNSGYHSIRQTQTNYFSDSLIGFDSASGVEFPDFVKVAEAFGFPARRYSRHSEIADMVAFISETDGPAFVEVMIDPMQGFAPKLASRMLASGMMSSPALEDLAPFLSREELQENMFIPLLD